jgi:DNA-binding winged helix-turn-helix (wHTH) protein
MNKQAPITQLRAARATALLALRPALALPFASAFAERGCAPTIAFSRRQLAAFCEAADIVIADEEIDAGAAVLGTLSGPAITVRMFVAAPPGVVAANVEHLDIDVPPQRIVAHALALVDALRVRRADSVLSWGALELDLLRRRSRWRGNETDLTATQFDILATLVRAGGSVVSKTELQRAVWPDAEPDNGERLLAHIRRIRLRMEADPSRPAFLITTRGIGFRLADPDEDGEAPLTLVANQGGPESIRA